MTDTRGGEGNRDSAPLYLIAVLKPKVERADDVRTALGSLMAASQAEPGCHYYDLVVGTDDPTTWYMIEKWASEAAWQEHMRTPHVTSFNAQAEEYFRAPTELRRYSDR